MPESPKMTYLPELDGLRAVAILAVLVFHFEPGWLQGGFLGVDLFFVLSGYLITRKIQPQILAGTFSFRDFYAGRARRLLPVFLITLLLTWAGAWWLLLPQDLKSLSSSTLAALSGWVNYQFSRRLDYFSPDLSAQPLLHTWSLAVEEQFYLLFPLLLVLGRRWVKLRWAAVVLLGLISWGMSIFMPAHAFFGLESRAWELGVGCLVAQMTLPKGLSAGKTALLSWLGLITCVGSFLGVSESSPLPCPAAVPIVLGTGLLILTRCGGPGSWLHAACVLAPVRYLGRISYSLYLLHWPLLVLGQKLALEWGTAEKALTLSLSLLLTVGVHHLIENPIRRTTTKNSLIKLGVPAVTLWLLLMVVSFQVRQRGGLLQSPAERSLAEVLPDYAARKPDTDRWLSLGLSERVPDLLLIGDSHAQSLITVLDEHLQSRRLAARAWVAHATVPLTGITTSASSERLTREVLPEVLKSPTRRVVLCASWSSYLLFKKDGWQTRSRRLSPHPNADESRQLITTALDQTLALLTQAGKDVLIVDPIPSYPRHVPEYLIKHRLLGVPPALELGTQAEHTRKHQNLLHLLDQAVQKYPQVQRLDSPALFQQGGRLLYHLHGHSLYEDNSHLSRLGAGLIVPHLISSHGG